MRYQFKIYCLKIILIIIPTIQKSYAQTQKTVFQHITTKNGLSQNLVTSIFRDKNGYMWFATLNGLNYYNGYNIVVYKNDSNKYSISSNLVNSICDDQNGDLWIATRNGLNKFIFDQNRFIQYFNDPSNTNSIADNNIRNVFRDKKNNIWICTNSHGIDKLTFIDNKPFFKHYTHLKGSLNSISANRVNCVTEDHLGNIWIGTADGLNKLNPLTDKIEIFKNDLRNTNSLSNNSVNTIIEGNEHILWIGTKFGLTKFDTQNILFTCYYSNPGDPKSLASSAIRFLTKDITGNIIIATLDGLHRYDPSKNTFFRFEYSPNLEYSLNNNFTSCLFSDREGNVWVGTEKGGVNKYNIFQQKFFNFVYKPNNPAFLNSEIANSIYEDNLNIWIGTAGGGLNQFDKKTHLFKYHTNQPSNPQSISHNYISGITKDSHGNIWIATWGMGINKLTNINKGTFKNYSFASANTDSINWNLVSCMFEFPKGNMWIASRFGLSRINLNTGKISMFKTKKTGNITLFRLSCVMKDSKNNLWVGTEEGLFRIKWNNNLSPDLDQPDSIFRYVNDNNNKSSIAGNHIVSMLEDRKGNLWFSAYGFGLEKLELKNINGTNTKFVHYLKANSRLDNYIYGILEDDNNNLWLSTENGLQKFNPNNNSCQTFFESDGIQGNQFYWNSYYKNASGQMLFGGTQGLTYFYPDSIVASKPIEKIIFTDFKIFNKSVPVNLDNTYSLKRHINNTTHIELQHKQNVFTVEFTVLNYDITTSSEYAYKLEGFDENWIYVDNSRRYATYTNLSPGNYLFRVKAANRDGIWNEKEATMRISILPEWWQTLLFKVAVFLFISLSILFTYLRRIHNLKAQQRKLEQKVAQRTEMLQKQNQEIVAQKDEILAQKDEILTQKDEIASQNQQLHEYSNHLEVMVRERTSDLELAKNRAEEADKLKSSFLSNLSHEIRTPLNAIVGFSVLIANCNLQSDPIKDWSKVIMKNSDSLLRLISDIIDFAKIETGQIAINNQIILIYNLIKEAFDTYQMKVNQNIISINDNVSLNIAVADEYKSIVVYTDPGRVNQIIGNLLDNAIKFTEKGQIEIGLKLNNGEVLIWIKDTGIGIDPRHHEAIFDRFRKIEDNTDHIYRGTGLGLALVKNLIQLLGGKIWIESEMGQGSTFYFTLSLQTSNYPLKDNKKTILKPIDKNATCNILIAEDEDTNFFYLKTILEKEKMIVTRAKNGKEAIELCSKMDKLDLILMDIKMPVMDGIAATIEIKKTFPQIPIFAVTAYALSDEKEKFSKAEFDEYITKPVLNNFLISLIRKYTKT